MEKVLSGSLEQMVEALVSKDLPLVSNLSNVASLLYKEIKGTSWCGFYLTFEDKDELYLGPFQGDVACTIIPFGKGVCGTCALEKKTQLVPNVHEIKNHIACSSSTNSEIVVPIIKNDRVVGVIDLDSENFSNFDEMTQSILEKISYTLSHLF